MTPPSAITCININNDKIMEYKTKSTRPIYIISFGFYPTICGKFHLCLEDQSAHFKTNPSKSSLALPSILSILITLDWWQAYLPSSHGWASSSSLSDRPSGGWQKAVIPDLGNRCCRVLCY